MFGNSVAFFASLTTCKLQEAFKREKTAKVRRTCHRQQKKRFTKTEWTFSKFLISQRISMINSYWLLSAEDSVSTSLSGEPNKSFKSLSRRIIYPFFRLYRLKWNIFTIPVWYTGFGWDSNLAVGHAWSKASQIAVGFWIHADYRLILTGD